MDDIPTSSPEGTPAPQTGPTPPPVHSAPPPLLQPRVPQTRARSGSGWKTFAIICLILLLGSLVFNPLHILTEMMSGDGMPRGRVVGPRLQESYLEDNHSKNKIAVIPIDGVISGQGGRSGYTMVDLIEDQFRRAEKDESVKAVILKVNSPGGEVLASDDIYKIIQKFQEKTGKPVVSDMGSVAASGGYYVSAPCQWIVANELTIT